MAYELQREFTNSDRKDWFLTVSKEFARMKLEDAHGDTFEMDTYTFLRIAEAVKEGLK